MNKKLIKITTKILLCALFAVLDYYISLLLAKTHFKPLFLDTLFEMSISGGVIGRIVAAIQKTPYSMTVQA